MKVLITGGGGFIGYRLARKLLERGTLAGRDGRPAPITQIKLLDGAFPPSPDPRLVCVQGDLSAPGLIGEVLDHDTASVFHLAAVVSAGAEADFDLGYRVNLDGSAAGGRDDDVLPLVQSGGLRARDGVHPTEALSMSSAMTSAGLTSGWSERSGR